MLVVKIELKSIPSNSNTTHAASVLHDILYSQSISRAETFKISNKIFHDLLFKVINLDISIIMLTVILPHISIVM